MQKITINDYKSAFISNDFVVKSGSWIVDLKDVQFMTYRLNDKDETSYLVAFHIGDKETKIMVSNIEAVRELFKSWTNAKGTELEFEFEDIKGEVREWD